MRECAENRPEGRRQLLVLWGQHHLGFFHCDRRARQHFFDLGGGGGGGGGVAVVWRKRMVMVMMMMVIHTTLLAKRRSK